MGESKRGASDLVMTQADLPPGIDAPSPQAVRDRVSGGSAPDDVEAEVRRLAERVGGMARLRELVTVLAAGDR